MIASTHLAIGAVSGMIVGRINKPKVDIWNLMAGALIAGIASHIILDAIPHAEYLDYIINRTLLFNIVVLIELIAVSLIVLNLKTSSDVPLLMTLGLIGAAIPDGIVTCGKFLDWGWMINLGNLLHLFHANQHSPLEVSFSGQIVLAAIVLYSLRIYARPHT